MHLLVESVKKRVDYFTITGERQKGRRLWALQARGMQYFVTRLWL